MWFLLKFYSGTPYKLIYTSKCLSADDIPKCAEIYNSNLYLLKCKIGYKLLNETLSYKLL